MGFALQQRETKEQVSYTLPLSLADQIAERAKAMHVTVDEAVAMLLKNGLNVQDEKEQELQSLYSRFHESSGEERDEIFEKFGQSIFGK